MKRNFYKDNVKEPSRANLVPMIYVRKGEFKPKEINDLIYNFKATRHKIQLGGNIESVCGWTFGDPLSNTKEQIEGFVKTYMPWVEKAMAEYDGVMFDLSKTESNKSTNGEDDENLNGDDYVDSIFSEIEELIENVPLEAKDVKIKLEEFKKDLINSISSEEFKEKMRNRIFAKTESLGHEFSFKNKILIALQDPEATYVKSGHGWAIWNRYPAKNAPRIWLWVPNFANQRGILDGETKERLINLTLNKYKVKRIEDLPPNVIEELTVDLRTYFGKQYKMSNNFYDIRFTNVKRGHTDDFIETIKRNRESQVPWFDGTSNETPQTKKLFKIVYDIILDHRITVKFVNSMGGSRGTSSSGVITLLKHEPINAGYVNTAIHEFSHELLHQHYAQSQNPELVKYFVGRKKGRDTVEQQAELCAWIVLKNYGFDMDTNINYTSIWGLNEDNAIEVFDSISNTAQYIVTKINQKLSKNYMTESVKLNESFLPSGQELANMLGYGEIYQASLENKKQMNYNENIKMNQEPQMNMESTQIKLSESEFKEFLTEAVKNVLNEISYGLAKNAYDKMMNKGQEHRACDLNQTFKDINDDDNAKYSLQHDTLDLYGDSYPHEQDIDAIFATQYQRNNNSDVKAFPRKQFARNGKLLNNRDRQTQLNQKHRITTNPKIARSFAKHMKNFDPDTELTRDDFRL